MYPCFKTRPPPSPLPPRTGGYQKMFFEKYTGFYGVCIKYPSSLQIEATTRGALSKKREAVVRKCSVKKVFLEISQNSQETTCARVFFAKVASLRPATLLKKRI